MNMSDPFQTWLAFGFPGGWEWMALLLLGLLIFGRRLPEVGRSLGRGIVEFKRGIKGIEDDVDDTSSRPGSPAELADERNEHLASKPEPAGEPRREVEATAAEPTATKGDEASA